METEESESAALAAAWMWEVGRREGFGQPRRRLIWCFVCVASPIFNDWEEKRRVELLAKEYLEVNRRRGMILSIEIN